MVQMVPAELFNLNYRPTSMKLYTGTVGQTWTLAGEMGPGGSPSQFVGQTVQYIWIEMTGNPPSNFPLIKDITYDIPLGASSGDSINTFYKPANAFDGNPDTWWTGAQNQTQWNLIYQFTTDTYVTSADMVFYSDKHAPTNITLYTSLDGNTWTNHGAVSGAATVTLPAGATSRYVRFVMNGVPNIGYPLIKDISMATGTGGPCATDLDCNDGNALTTDACFLAGTANAVCGYYSSTRVADAGNDHSCAAMSSGQIKCWGSNFFGMLGNGSTTDSAWPVNVVGVTNAATVSNGYRHTCATLSNGSARCWGENVYGELGNGAAVDSSVPVAVNGLSNVVSIEAARYYTCALLSTGIVKCWGANSWGELGDGTTNNSTTPVSALGITNAVSVSAQFTHTCAALSTGRVKCWGGNAYGGLGNGTSSASGASPPVDVTGITNATGVALGRLFSCALLNTGGVKCWGLNDKGQLGNGTTTDALTPVSVTGISDAVLISAGFNFACALLSSGDIKCWGANGTGSLGDGTYTNSSTPVSVVGISDAVDLGSGMSHTCAANGSGVVSCWGGNWANQLGYIPGCPSWINVPNVVSGL